MTESNGDEDQPKVRRGQRRAVSFECDVIRQDSDDPVRCLVTDLSQYGMWIETGELLLPGERLVVSFRPPHWPSPFAITVFGEVARVSMGRRKGDQGITGMGVEFTDLTDAERRALTACLKGLPPPLPRHRFDE